ncbi:TonB family protein [Reyranella sp.]|uniref:TonB family protein n=1 Tax=Reyranella sp. TaxID=1929291 RepID=UPI000BD69F4E|nr:TonB family protein [Reyranella sp.]OYY42357.1 MAG: hypothetical protein B7Y57_12165 [Rhodospirillales bacterium 35-66-84]OYZ94043.1 MAG: hypothetical protein B7Y08_14810 [Rhodospirillales bacterium 24-66-33]OZB22308.1 MAG: hypothetical protein B7X63_23030 [Rhodospirillales bacterium 39-66-50]HQS17576.1 TonB family protein [Reyranella sp.]HQT14295.1 TonB family protein [Reyranella sp.]
MAHAVSAFSYRSDRISPVALALAILLHALVAAALWWLAYQKPPVPPVEEAITVSFEQPKPLDPPAPPPLPPAAQPRPVPVPQAQPPVAPGVRPPAPVTADRPTQAPPTSQVSKEPPAPPPPPESKEEPRLLTEPEVAPPTPTPPVAARAEPPPEQGLKAGPTPPPQNAPPAPPAKPTEPTPAPKPIPQQQALASPPRPPPPAPKPAYKPSPLSTAPSQRAPSASSAEQPSQHRFVNPSDTYARAKVADNYLSEVLRKIVGYRYTSSTQRRQGVTVVRIIIARDGRLLGATVISSSGEPEFDEGVLAGVRAGSPYSPLPDNIKGASAPFDLPLVSVRR